MQLAPSRRSLASAFARTVTTGVLLCAACSDSRRPQDQEPPPARPPASTAEREAARTTAAAEGEERAGTIYVPAYASFPTAERGRVALGILLSVRNVDPEATITLRFVDYYDTPGHRMRRYVETPRSLGPLGTQDFLVPASDEFGGSGANFLVGWTAAEGTREPLVEAVMVGHAGNGYLSFTSRGVAIEAHSATSSAGGPTPRAEGSTRVEDPWRDSVSGPGGATP